MLAQFQTTSPKDVEPVTDVAPDDVDSLMAKARSGNALLRVVAYPWGVELDVCEHLPLDGR